MPATSPTWPSTPWIHAAFSPLLPAAALKIGVLLAKRVHSILPFESPLVAKRDQFPLLLETQFFVTLRILGSSSLPTRYLILRDRAEAGVGRGEVGVAG